MMYVERAFEKLTVMKASNDVNAARQALEELQDALNFDIDRKTKREHYADQREDAQRSS
ncbi:MAG TPA: hypothetical protein VEJ63_23270 [Planctomycetota bacterium]|nr:hypothetical protein [Planctomycetota bacterium]